MKEKHIHTQNNKKKKTDVEKYKEMINFETEREGTFVDKIYLLFEFLSFSYHETGNRFNLLSIA